ncbi:GNAT family N-acetyltransferase [Aquipuribacter sp. SD81]|uniref:GNAT family N-acetyltransferase n=1 Tax=Aquipuribacter sp. SD81 TaxID=3127703 RepID=UPI003016DA24
MGFEPFGDTRPADTPWPSLVWPVPAGTVLGDGRVELSALDPDRDAAELHAALDDDRVWRHLAGRAADPAGLAAVLRERRDHLGWHQWCVRSAVTGQVLGTTSYLEVSVPDARLEVGATAYAPAVWGTAVNPACKLLVLGHAFEVLRAGRVQLKTDVRNERSQRAIERLGARPEGLLRRYQRRADGTVRDTALFSVTAEEWPAVREGLRRRLA